MMLKLLKNEWKRYRLFSIIMIGVSVLVGLLLILAMFLASFYDDIDDSAILAAGNIILVSLIIYCIPYAAVVYGILSYSTDIGRKGMIFLTPVPTWKVILSKLIYTSVFFVILYAISRCSIMITYSDVAASEISKAFNLFSSISILFRSDNVVLNILVSFMQYFFSVIHIVILVMASISLGRFSANSVGVQVFLSILFYIAISIIESLVSLLIVMIMDMFNYSIGTFSSYHIITSWIGFIISIVFSIALYIVSVCLTDKKVNLVS